MHELILLIAGFLAAFVGAMSGGGAGLITLFTLLSFGIPLNAAIATNKLGDFGFFLPALRNFIKAKQINKKSLPMIILVNLAGVTIGTFLIAYLDEKLLTKFVIVILMLLILLSIFRKNDALRERAPKKYWSLVYFGTSITSGALGAGTGILSTITLIYFRGFKALQAMAHSFFANFFGSSLSVTILFFTGLINYKYGIFLLIGNIIGAHFGSRMVIKRGNSFARYMIIVIAVCILLQLLFFG